MVKKITLVSSYAYNTLHQSFETGLVQVCALITNHLICYKDSSTFEYIREKALECDLLDRIELRSIRVINARSKVKTLIKEVYSPVLDVYSFFSSGKESVLVYAYSYWFSLFLINMLNKIYHKPVIFFCHGELELLINKGGGILARTRRRMLRFFFNRKHIEPNIHFAVLGDSLLTNLKSSISDSSYEHFFSMESPCNMSKREYHEPNRSVFRFGLVGTVSVSKGLKDLISFIDALELRGVPYECSIIGRIAEKEYANFFNDKGIYIPEGYLSRDEFENRICDIDFVTFFYPSDTYRLISSGALLDAISLSRPVLSINNSFFNYIKEKTGFPILMCDNVMQMVNAVTSNKVWDLYDSDFEGAKSFFSAEKISESLLNVLSAYYPKLIM